MTARWALVGRSGELDTLTRALDGGRGGLVLCGAAGVGKTRLADEMLRRAERTGRATAWVRATRSTAALPFGAFAHLMPADVDGLASSFDAMRRATADLRDVAAGRGLVVGIDDAHLLDEPSAALAHHLVTTGTAFVVATVRAGERVPDAVRSLWKDELAGRIEVGPLSRVEVDELLAAVLDGQVDTATRHRLWEAGQGNALFLRELVLMGLDRGALAERDGVWSWDGPLGGGVRLRELIEERLSGVAGPARAAMEVLAVGEPLPEPVLCAVVGSAVLRELDGAGLLAAAPDGWGLRLGHPLYGESLRHGLTPLRRREICGRLTDALIGRGDDDLLRRGVWSLEAGRHDDGALLVAAARRAHALFDHALGERLALAAIAAGRADASVVLGASLHGQRRFDEAARVLGSHPPAGAGDELLVEWALVAARNTMIGLGDAPAAEAVLGAVEARLRVGAARDRLVAYRAYLVFLNGRMSDALAIAESANAPDQDLEARFRSTMARTLALGALGRSAESLALSRTAVDSGGPIRAERPMLFSELRYAEWAVCWVAGRYAEMERRAQDGLADVVRGGHHDLYGTWVLAVGVSALVRGRPRTALDRIREALPALRRYYDPAGMRGFGLASLAQSAALLGRVDEARAAMAEWERVRHPGVHIFDALNQLGAAWTAAASGELSAAARRAIAAADIAVGQHHPTLELEALHQAVRLGARGLAARIARVGARTDHALAGCYAEHAAALAAGDGPRLERCALRFAELDVPLLAAEAAVEASEAYRHRGSAADALRAAGLLRRWRDACEGARTPVLAREPGGAARSLLTPRERELAELAARGLSNREIAARLVLSPRTVGNHLAHVYAKLGIAGRAELGALLTPVGGPNS
ncbi:MAG: LuxR C-terminal-related transcriptional regulator [Pseudonocardia sp.]